jgi:hypothetical protein
MPTATAASKIAAAPKPVPLPNADFYQLIELGEIEARRASGLNF